MALGSAGWWRLRFQVPPWAEDALVSFLVDCGIPGVQVEGEGESLTFTAYLPRERPFVPLQDALKSYVVALEEIHGPFAHRGPEIEELRGEDWREAWKSHFHVTTISSRLVVKPSWETLEPGPGVVVLEIDPGQAFGTGLHATTRMCLTWIDEMVREERGFVPTSALDLGTGTGILAIALARLGVREIWAVDNDPLATEAARVNARINGVADRVMVVDGSLGEIRGRSFPLVLGNLTGALLLSVARDLGGFVEPRGRLLLSGILTEEKEKLRVGFERVGLGWLGEREDGEWCAMLLERSA
jgi:ribosomal protein L11 methyltransferase